MHYDFADLLDIWYDLFDIFTSFLAFSKVDLVPALEDVLNILFGWIPGVPNIDFSWEFNLSMLWDGGIMPLLIGLMIIAGIFRAIENILDILP